MCCTNLRVIYHSRPFKFQLLTTTQHKLFHILVFFDTKTTHFISYLICQMRTHKKEYEFALLEMSFCPNSEGNTTLMHRFLLRYAGTTGAAAINSDDLSRDVRSCWHAKKCHHICDLLRLPGTILGSKSNMLCYIFVSIKHLHIIQRNFASCD
jgi:hypothetical protein